MFFVVRLLLTSKSYKSQIPVLPRRAYIKSFYPKLLAAILFLFIASCSNDPETIRALTGRAMIQEDKAYGVTFIYSQDGDVRMRIKTKEFVRNTTAKRPYMDMKKGLRIEFFSDSTGEIEDVLTAKNSRYYEIQRDYIVWDSVRIVTKKGEKLETDELIWNESAQKFFTEKPVSITTKDEILYGNGMEANHDFSWYRIVNPKGSVQVDKGELPK